MKLPAVLEIYGYKSEEWAYSGWVGSYGYETLMFLTCVCQQSLLYMTHFYWCFPGFYMMYYIYCILSIVLFTFHTFTFSMHFFYSLSYMLCITVYAQY